MLLGTAINASAIIAGAVAGICLKKRFSPSMAQSIMQGIALMVVVLGIGMAQKTANPLIVIISLVVGTVLGELFNIEGGLQRLGEYFQSKFAKGEGDFAKGFVSASLIYCVGAMAIMGALEEGLSGKFDILSVKAMLDGISAVVFAATLGIGVAFSAITVFVYQGSITLFAGWIGQFLSDPVVAEMTATGGVLIIGIGVNMLELGKRPMKVGNMLPAIFVAALLAWGIGVVKG